MHGRFESIGLNSGKESRFGTPAVQRWPVGLSLKLSALAAEAQAQQVKASTFHGASPIASPGEELAPVSSKPPPPPSNYDDMMNDLKLLSKAQLTSYGKR